MTEVIFTTVHGSHLYGMASPFSDVDTFTVTTSSQRARQRMNGIDDSTTIGWDAFLDYALSGSHQSLEALFSPVKEWHSHEYLQPMLDQYRVCGADVLSKYKRTIKKFSHAQDFKSRRHACRLWLNMQQLRTEGRFNPRMTTDEIAWATEVATSDIDGYQLEGLLLDGENAFGSFLRDHNAGETIDTRETNG